MEGYRQLRLFPEVNDAPGHTAQPQAGDFVQRLARDAESVDRTCRLSLAFDAVISVDELKTFKPHPSVYGLVTRHLGQCTGSAFVREFRMSVVTRPYTLG